MSIKLPNTPVFLPQVPDTLREGSPELYDYLQRLRLAVQQAASGAFSNAYILSTAINSGTSGTFVMSSGGHLIVTSGIVIRITS